MRVLVWLHYQVFQVASVQPTVFSVRCLVIPGTLYLVVCTIISDIILVDKLGTETT